MSRDQAFGAGIFIVALLVTIVYLFAFFAPILPLNIEYADTLRDWAIALPILLLVLAALVITMWIGWTMLTTPPPLPLEEEKFEETAPTLEPPKEEKPKPRVRTKRKSSPRRRTRRRK